MNDATLARELVDRLNLLCREPAARELIGKLIELRIPAYTLVSHPTIQFTLDGHVGFLGLLNGAVGIVKSGKLARTGGYIAAAYQDGRFVGFSLTSPT